MPGAAGEVRSSLRVVGGTDLPTGEVTFLFTDIEGSTALLRHLGEEAYGVILDRHHRLLRETVAAHGGSEFNSEGDALYIAFSNAADALAAAVDGQLSLAAHQWPEGAVVRVRMGVHTGTPTRWGDDYMGLAVHEAARIASVAHGGQVLVSPQTRRALDAPPGPATLKSLGRHRLKDLGEPIELYQLCHPELRADFPATRSLERVSHNLPLQPSSFLGRTEELARGSALLKDTRLLTLTGPGGTGKTRLAYQLAATLMESFPDGIWAVELGLTSDSTLVPDAVTAALGLQHQPGRTPTQVAVEHLRTRTALVVLDNCEHVLDASADLVSSLMRECQTVRIVATTREPLRLQGERVWPLAPLRVPASTDMSVEALAAADAVQLFCERAVEVDATFALTPTNAADVATICGRLEGMPLALELAAAWVRSLSPAQIAERLRTNMDLLSKGRRGATARHESMRGAIAWSYELLSDEERDLFCRLAVFEGGWTLEAAEATCWDAAEQAADVTRVLDALVDKSLVATTRGETGAIRYRFLDTVRHFASEQLAATGQRDVVVDRHIHWCTALAQSAAALPTGSSEWAEGLDLLGVDHANLLAALDRLHGAGRAAEAARLALDLAEFWDVRGHWQLARRELQRYVGRADRDQLLTGQCLLRLGRLAVRLGEWEEARARFEEATGIARDLGERRLEGQCIGGLGHVAWCGSDYPEARARFDEAIVIARTLGERSLEGQCVGGLGEVALRLGDYAGAQTRFRQALAIARQLGDRRLEGQWVGGLGIVAVSVGDCPEARAHLEQALGIARELGDRRLEAFSVGGLGSVARELGDWAEARARYAEAVGITREIGDRRLECLWGCFLAGICCSVGDYAEARGRCEDALSMARELGVRRVEGQSIGSLADVASGLGDHAQARARYEDALAIARELRERRHEGRWVRGLGDVAFNTGDYAEAQCRYEESLVIARELLERPLECAAIRGLGDVALALRDTAGAQAHYQRALSIAREVGQRDCDLLEACADLFARLDRCEDAAQLLAVADHLNSRANRVRGAAAQARYDATLTTCRGKLGEEALASVSRGGGALDWASATDAPLEFLEHVLVPASIAPHSAEVAVADDVSHIGGDLAPGKIAGRARIRTLGRFSVAVDDEEVPLTAWGSRRARQLCKRLAAACGSPVSRDQLMDVLWPDDVGAERLSARLSVQLSTVRRILGGGIIADRASVRLDLDKVRIDITDLDEAVESGDLDRVLELYGGEFLPEDLYEDWSATPRERARSAYARAARKLAIVATEAGNHEKAADLACRVLATDPFDDDGHRQLITALAAGGRWGEARRAYESYAGRMDELGVPCVPLDALVPTAP